MARPQPPGLIVVSLWCAPRTDLGRSPGSASPHGPGRSGTGRNGSGRVGSSTWGTPGCRGSPSPTGSYLGVPRPTYDLLCPTKVCPDPAPLTGGSEGAGLRFTVNGSARDLFVGDPSEAPPLLRRPTHPSSRVRTTYLWVPGTSHFCLGVGRSGRVRVNRRRRDWDESLRPVQKKQNCRNNSMC